MCGMSFDLTEFCNKRESNFFLIKQKRATSGTSAIPEARKR